jgi:hypothetical protein
VTDVATIDVISIFGVVLKTITDGTKQTKLVNPLSIARSGNRLFVADTHMSTQYIFAIDVHSGSLLQERQIEINSDYKIQPLPFAVDSQDGLYWPEIRSFDSYITRIKATSLYSPDEYLGAVYWARTAYTEKKTVEEQIGHTRTYSFYINYKHNESNTDFMAVHSEAAETSSADSPFLPTLVHIGQTKGEPGKRGFTKLSILNVTHEWYEGYRWWR